MKKFLLIASLLLLSGASLAQSYAETVWVQLQSSWENYFDEGYSLKSYIIGSIEENNDNTWTFYFNDYTDYTIVGFCDEDCNDLDLYIEDEFGDEITKDVLDDDFPVLNFSPDYSGRYSVKVSMYSCTTEPCYWGIGIFEE